MDTRTTRRILAAGLMAALLLPVLGGPPLASADEPITRDHRDPVLPGDPAERIQIVIRQLYVFDDGDLAGKGEIRLRLSVARCAAPCVPPDEAPQLVSAAWNFSANSGDFLDPRTLPGAGDTLPDGVSTDSGIPLHRGEQYKFMIEAWEDDPGLSFTPRSFLTQVINADNDWGVGEHVQFHEASGATIPGYRIFYEIRRMPLPDLIISNLRQIDGGDGLQFVCAQVTNVGQRPSSQFQMVVHADGALLKTIDPMPALAVGQDTEACVLPELSAGEHPFSFRVDEARRVAEMNEINNLYESKFTFHGGAAAGQQTGVGPGAASSGATDASSADTRAAPVVSARPAGARPLDVTKPPMVAPVGPDLQVSAIEVVGREGGRCVEGRNAIFVTVKSDGGGSIGEFAIRVKLDDEVIDTATLSMSSNSEKRVPMAPVRMKPGTHTVQAIVDAANTVPEDDESNNTKSVEVKCVGS